MYPAAGTTGRLDGTQLVEENTVAVPQRIPVRFEDVFPQGAYVLTVEAANDFEKVKAGLADVQARDKGNGERVWSVRVLDADPSARRPRWR